MTLSRHVPKLLVCGRSGFLTDASALLQTRFGCLPIQVADPRQLLSRVYEEMPSLILAQIDSPQDPAMDVLAKIKRDAVLEYIPIAVVASQAYPHELFRLANEVLTDFKSREKLAVKIAGLLLEVEHQLDVNPFTGLPGHHTSVEKIQNAVDLGGEYAVCTIQFRNLEMFASIYGAMSADTLFNRMVEEIRRSFERIVGGHWFFGHLGKKTFVTALPDSKAEAFAADIVGHFDRTYAELAAYATQQQFVTSKDPLRANYTASDRVMISVLVLPLGTRAHRSAQDLIRASAEIHSDLKDNPGNVSIKFQITDASGPEEPAAGVRQGDAALVKRFLEKGRIETHFQPIVDFWENNIFAYEALSRFIELDGTMVHPVVLFDAARASGLVVEMDLRCIETALEAYEALKTDAKLFLNLNRETFVRLGEHISLFDRPSVLGDRLVIELTEQSMIGERDKVLQVKSLLQQRGIQIAYDDAGTGEVSFREVGEIKPAFVKFDRQLVSGITRSPLKQRHVLSMKAFAKGIGAQTIAEGIEMPSEFNHFKTIRLNFAQGYFIAKPKKDPDRRIEIKTG